MKANLGLIVISLGDLNALLDEKFLRLRQDLNVSAREKIALDKDELLTRQQAKEFLKISYPTLNNWSQKKVIEPIKVQGRVYCSRRQLLSLAANGGT